MPSGHERNAREKLGATSPFAPRNSIESFAAQTPGASGIDSIETNWAADCTRPTSSGGVIAIRYAATLPGGATLASFGSDPVAMLDSTVDFGTNNGRCAGERWERR